ncbi:GspE/PulE family protein [Singulisphaera sp. PoT]|uniref:GspE/PulE family protein n=1 Tax=Singulisphaera sp. PoT TaxID=3411797 RepID=UPI003BF54DDC
MTSRAEAFAKELASKSPGRPTYALEAVDLVLAEARTLGASDIHWLPTAEGLALSWRIDGVLQPAALLPVGVAPNVVARLKVLAELLTYRTDVPQEGRLRVASGEVEMRLSTFPTLYGEKAVVRLFAASGRFLRLDDLGLPDEIRDRLRELLQNTSGAIVLSGPAGSGKTTTIYACLRELVETSKGQRSLTTLEDPIEVPVPGVSQSQVNAAAGFTLEVGLRSILRQDPEVITVGEIRDPATAEIAFQASLTGHLVLTTYHAGSASGVVGRLVDMGIEPYLLRSGILAIVCQRLVRRLCTCATPTEDPAAFLGLAVERAYVPTGCPECVSTGYRGRAILAELLLPDRGELGQAIIAREDVAQLERAAVKGGMTSLWERARLAVEAGTTSPAEVRRVLGPSGSS